jgi:hypothetical protein
MSVLVNDDSSVERAVALRSGTGPNVHAHARHLTIGRRREVGVVGTRTILDQRQQLQKNRSSRNAYLCVENNFIGALASSAVVVSLKVASSLVETKSVKQIVVHVRGVEQLSHRRIHVRRGGCRGGGERENVVVGASAAGPVVGEVSVASGGVCLCNGIVSTGHSVARSARAVPAELGSGRVLGVGNGRPAAFAGVGDSPRASICCQ